MHSGSTASNPGDEKIKELLDGLGRIAVVGLSAREDRASHGIAKFLAGQGLEVVGVNPVLEEDVLGLEIYPSLKDVPGRLDLVDVFRHSEAVPPIVDDALEVGAGAIWLQEGVVHEEAAAKARRAGVEVVQDRCIYKEWLRLKNAS